ncbi:alpha-N-acetylgalactosamine-specific lectin-like [Branchiostoma floridae]|uniref:Alpha-N-acetylgalactosamine-specific lectin-like n=1 Tax=Branchiostoma floridae TaxID=7739 RepID=A0A9J7MV22_BRAFL|nr:alpha-N-acetylgalactosamine-specific lectin-like [Branchiostoma floridae]
MKRDQDDMFTTIDALKRASMYKEGSRIHALEQSLHEMSYAVFRGICYKAFNTRQTFSEAVATCGEDGGTLAMPRDAEINAFLISLYKSVSDSTCGYFWFGLHDQREEGNFEWMDGSALGTYNSWYPGEPNNNAGREDCVLYQQVHKDMWNDGRP